MPWSPLPQCARLRRIRAVVRWVLGAAAVCALVSAQAADGDRYRGRLLVEVLREFQDGGLTLVFSSAVVPLDLRVTVEPSATEPRAVLDEILPPLELRAEEGPGGSILVIPRGPQLGTVSGRVVSAASGAPVGSATIRLEQTSRAVLSSADGAFEIPRVVPGRYDLVVEALGFWPADVARVRVEPERATGLTVELTAQPAYVTEIVVTPSRLSVVREEQASRHVISNEDAVLAPTIGGDISRVVELMPGVAGADNSAAFNVRGSLARDVSFVLDGLELYDPFHLQSFQSPFSLIDNHVVDRIEFVAGGFTADLGDRHGGFVDVSTFVPGDPAGGDVELGTLNSRLTYRTPLSPRGSMLVSARAWYPSSVRDTIELGAGENLNPQFGDIYTKAEFHLSPRTILSAHGLFSYDRLTFTETDEDLNEAVDALTRNGYAWVRVLGSWADGLTSETLISGGKIERIRDGVSAPDAGLLVVDDERDVLFFGLKHDSILLISDAHLLKAGLDIRRLEADYRYFNEMADDPQDPPDPQGTSLAVYAAYRARATDKIATEVGLRWDRQTYTNDNQLSPRFNVVWRASERSELRLALGRFHQSQRIHELSVEDGETEFHRAEVAEQVELSLRHQLRDGMRLRLDGYYRKLSKLGTRYENLWEPIELFPETTDDRVEISPSEARLSGVELLLRGDPNQPLFWWVSYALSTAEDEIDGRDVPRSWDQTHAGKFLVGFRRDQKWSVSLSGTAHTGWPTTPMVEDEPGERNSERFDHYARLDFKLRKSFTLRRGRLWLTLEAVNLTDRKNPCCVDEFVSRVLPDGSTETRALYDHWLGFTPSFSVLWEF